MTISENHKIIAVVPAYNEEKSIAKVIHGIKPFVDEVIVIDDGSYDRTRELAMQAGAVVLFHETNKGVNAAMNRGFREAAARGADILVTIDGDAQHKPEDAQKAIDLVLAGADVAVTERIKNSHIGERVYGWYTGLFCQIKDPTCGLKVFRREVYDRMGHYDTYGSNGAQLAMEACFLGFKIAHLPIEVEDRLDHSRFYQRLFYGNGRILKSMFKTMLYLKFFKGFTENR